MRIMIEDEDAPAGAPRAADITAAVFAALARVCAANTFDETERAKQMCADLLNTIRRFGGTHPMMEDSNVTD